MDDLIPYKVVHYLNQFYAGRGGEDYAGMAPYCKDGPAGPGKLLEASSKGALKVVGTVVCGDNRFHENPNSAAETLAFVKMYNPDAFVAGPAFLAGRYGEACAEMCRMVREELNIPVITGMAAEHPSLDRFRQAIPICRTGANGADMKNALPRMGALLVSRLRNEEPAAGEDAWLFTRGLKENILKDKTAAARAIDMLLCKYRGDAFTTEVPIPVNEIVKPARANTDVPLKIALITDGGLMRKGNPERMPSGRAKRFYEIGIDGLDRLSEEGIDVNHFGYDTRYVEQDPNRLVPLDVLRELEKAGELVLHPILFTTAGAVTAIEYAADFGRDIAKKLKNADIRAAILTST